MNGNELLYGTKENQSFKNCPKAFTTELYQHFKVNPTYTNSLRDKNIEMYILYTFYKFGITYRQYKKENL